MEATLVEFEKMNHPVIHAEHHLDGVLATQFHFPWNKTTWHGKTDYLDVNMRESGANVIFTFSSKPDLLSATKLNVELPEIKTISNEVQVKWVDDIFIHLVKETSFYQDNLLITKLHSGANDIYHNFFETENTRNMEKEARGDVPALMGFSSHLPKYPLEIVEPWFYNINTSNSWPLLNNDKRDITSQVYTFRRSFKELLRVRVLKDNVWVEVKYSDNYLDVPQKNFEVNIPKLSAVYTYLTDSEKEYYSSGCEQAADHKVIRFREFVPLNNRDRATVGEKFSFSVKTKNPCYSLFWVAENTEHEKNLMYGNYTLNHYDHINGDCPIAEYTLSYDNDVKSTGNNEHRCITQVRKHFPSKPKKNGFGCYSHAWYSANQVQADLSMFYGNINVKLDLELKDFDIDERRRAPVFLMKVYALVMKRVTFDPVSKEFLVDNYESKK